MILRRLGNKTKLSHKIIDFFPPHKIYIEPFFGAGGLFFNKPPAEHNYINDNDAYIYNLFNILKDEPKELERWVELMPAHNDLFQYWKENKETEPILKAVRFLLLSNFSYLGKMDTLKFGSHKDKKHIINNIEKTLLYFSDVKINNQDFEKFLKSFSFKDTERKKTFIYCDPPYLGVVNNYNNGFKREDLERLINTLLDMKVKFAISEFNSELANKLIEKYNLNTNFITERLTLKSRNIEILMTNYDANTLFN